MSEHADALLEGPRGDGLLVDRHEHIIHGDDSSSYRRTLTVVLEVDEAANYKIALCTTHHIGPIHRPNTSALESVKERETT
ncbi:hypothetical protein ON010_g14950 [Phytophthora cinnamomi]|nr:hypothetical protein ON010_g14950 [Phytophthora cinnamomi]